MENQPNSQALKKHEKTEVTTENSSKSKSAESQEFIPQGAADEVGEGFLRRSKSVANYRHIPSGTKTKINIGSSSAILDCIHMDVYGVFSPW